MKKKLSKKLSKKIMQNGFIRRLENVTFTF